MVCYGLGNGCHGRGKPGEGVGPAGEARPHCWEEREKEGQTIKGISLNTQAGSEGGVPLVQAIGGQEPIVWAKGSRGLRHGASCVICRQQGQTVVVVSVSGGRHGPPLLGPYKWAPPMVPVALGVSQKKRALQSSTTHYCSYPPGNTLALLWPLSNALSSTHMLDHCPLPRLYN